MKGAYGGKEKTGVPDLRLQPDQRAGQARDERMGYLSLLPQRADRKEDRADPA